MYFLLFICHQCIFLGKMFISLFIGVLVFFLLNYDSALYGPWLTPSLTQGHKDFSLTFSFVTFIDFAFTLKLLSLQVNFVYGARYGLMLPYFCIWISSCSSTTILCWITFLSSWKLYWRYVRGSISSFSVLFLWTICVYLSISTKWSGLSLLSSKAWY